MVLIQQYTDGHENKVKRWQQWFNVNTNGDDPQNIDGKVKDDNDDGKLLGCCNWVRKIKQIMTNKSLLNKGGLVIIVHCIFFLNTHIYSSGNSQQPVVTSMGSMLNQTCDIGLARWARFLDGFAGSGGA